MSSSLLAEIVDDIENNETDEAIGKIMTDMMVIYHVDPLHQLSLLAHAITEDDQTLIDFLLKHMDHDVLLYYFQETSIAFCIEFGTETTLRKLIAKFGNTINHVTTDGECALSEAIRNKAYKKAEMLLETGRADTHRLYNNKPLIEFVKLSGDEQMIALFNKK